MKLRYSEKVSGVVLGDVGLLLHQVSDVVHGVVKYWRVVVDVQNVHFYGSFVAELVVKYSVRQCVTL